MDKGPHKIVIVDDDHGVRAALERLLSASGYGVASFVSGAELLRAGALSGAACLVIDVQLGAESGLELVRDPAVQRSGVPVVFMTASDEPALGASSRAACLRKPFRAEELLAAVAAALGKAPCRS